MPARSLHPAPWLHALAAQHPASWPVSRSVRAALALGVPLTIGTLTDHTTLGLMAAIGALMPTVSEKPVPYPLRLRQIAVGAVMGAFGYVAIAVLPQHTAVLVPGVVVLALVAGVVSTWSARLSGGALQMLVLGSIAPHLEPLAGVWSVPLGVLAGATWTAALLLLEAAFRRRAPERDLLAAYLDALGRLAATPAPEPQGRSDDDAFEVARRAVTDARAAAYTNLLGVRAHTQGRSLDQEHRALVLASAGDVGALVLAHAVTRDAPTAPGAATEAPPSVAAPADAPSAPLATWLHAAAAGVRATRAVPSPPDDRAVPRDLARAAAALGDALRSGSAPTAGADASSQLDPSSPPASRPRSGLPNRFTLGPAAIQAATRLALCMGVAMLVATLVPGRSYWIPLTVAVVLKPDFGSVFVRAVHRSIGTMVGVVIGAGILAIVPKGPTFVVVIVVLVACLPWASQRSYAMVSVLLTPMVLVLIDYALPGPSVDLGAQRLLDTAIGSAIVLVLGYLVWPGTRRADVSGSFAALLATLADYLRAAADPRADLTTTRQERHTVYRGLSDLRTQLQRSLAEPPPASRTAAGWFPAVATAERLADQVTAALASPRDDVGAALAARADWLAGAAARSEPPGTVDAPGAGAPTEPRGLPGLGALDAELARLHRQLEEQEGA